MRNAVKLTIILVNHRHGAIARRAIESLYALPDRVEFALTVVDNIAGDNLSEWLAHHYPQTAIIKNVRPCGFAENVNKAIALGEGNSYCVLINPDIICRAGLLCELVRFMDEHPEAGIAGPRLLNADGSVQTSARSFSTLSALLVRGLHLDKVLRHHSIMRRYLLTDLDDSAPAEVDWVTGALMIVRSKAVEKVGKMDERYFLYSEDQDWCCRMWRSGWKVFIVPKAQAVHDHQRAGMRKPWSSAGRHQLASAIKMFAKFGWKINRGPMVRQPRY